MYKFTETIKSGDNFTPAGLIYKHGKKHRLDVLSCYGSNYLVIDGGLYGYDHYTITDNGNGTAVVTVYLALKSRRA